MPTRKKSSKKSVSIVEPCTTPPDPCPLCGRSGPIKPAAEPAAGVSVLHSCSDKEPRHEPPELDGPAVTAEEIEQAFDELPVQLPPSVRSKLSARLLKRNLHPSSEEGVEIVKTTCQAYLAKKQRAKAASAARRAAKKADTQPEAVDQQADVTP